MPLDTGLPVADKISKASKKSGSPTFHKICVKFEALLQASKGSPEVIRGHDVALPSAEKNFSGNIFYCKLAWR